MTGFFDFRSAHVTFLAALTLSVCTVIQSGSNPTASQASSGSAAHHHRSFFSSFSVGGFLRLFSLPFAWPTLVSLVLLLRFGRLLERRFGSARFSVLITFLGGSAAALYHALLTAVAPSVAGNQAGGVGVLAHVGGPASFITTNASVWNALIASLAAFAALRAPLASMPSAARRFFHGNNTNINSNTNGANNNTAAAENAQATQTGNAGAATTSTGATATTPLHSHSIFRFAPLAVTGLVAAANSYSAVITRAGGTRFVRPDEASLARVAAAALCAVAAGLAPAAAVHLYNPLLGMLTGLGDSRLVRSIVSGLLYSSSGSGSSNNANNNNNNSSPNSGGGVFYVRQQGAERRAMEAAMQQREAAQDDALQAAIRASMADQQHHRGGGAAAAAAGGSGDTNVRVLAGGDDGRRAGVGARRQPPFPAGAAAAANPALRRQTSSSGSQPQSQSHSASPSQSPAMASSAPAVPTPAEREALAVLKEIVPHVPDARMLAVLRTCRGDADAAAGLLLEGAG